MTDVRHRPPSPVASPRPRYRPGSLEVFGLILLTAVLLRTQLASLLTKVLPSGWSTVFVAICVQATPFLVLGVLVSGAIAAFVPASFFTRVMPKRAVLAVPLAGVCGIALPGCECGSVPIANRLIDRGVRPSAALAFLLSAPAINPIVLVATAVAFQAEPRMVWARLVGGLLTAVIVGLIWEKLGRPAWMKPRLRDRGDAEETGLKMFLPTMRGDFTQAAGFLVIGAAAAATLNTVVPRTFMQHVGGSVLLSIITMGAPGVLPGPLFGIRCICGGVVLDHPGGRQTRVPDGRPSGRHQTLRHAVGHVRPEVRGPLRSRHVCGGHRRRCRHRPAVLRRLALNKNTQSVMITLLGGLLISITVSGRYTSYVKPGFGPLLVIAGVILIVVGILSIVSGIRGDRKADLELEARAEASLDPVPAAYVTPVADSPEHSHDESDAHGHSHERSKAPWLILAPILVLLLLAPPALGADAVNRNAGSQALQGLTGVAAASGAGSDVAAGGTTGGYAPNDGSGHGIGTKAFAKQRPTMVFPALPTGQNPAMTLKEFIMRALYDADNTVSNNNITVVGFIADPGDGYTSGYSLARMTISCCAADASPMRVHVAGTAKYPVNTWVTAVISAQVGTADSDNDYVPTVDLVSMSTISQPSDPYEH